MIRSGAFTPSAKALAQKNNVNLIDGKGPREQKATVMGTLCPAAMVSGKMTPLRENSRLLMLADEKCRANCRIAALLSIVNNCWPS